MISVEGGGGVRGDVTWAAGGCGCHLDSQGFSQSADAGAAAHEAVRAAVEGHTMQANESHSTRYLAAWGRGWT